jgi:6-phosphogluconate dehydrogenase
MQNSADIGLIGLAVMGENLVLNMESRGFTCAVFNRTTAKVEEFVNGRGKGTSLEIINIGHNYRQERDSLVLIPSQIFVRV